MAHRPRRQSKRGLLYPPPFWKEAKTTVPPYPREEIGEREGKKRDAAVVAPTPPSRRKGEATN